MFSVESILYAWDNQVRLALKLMEDVTDEQMLLRPGGNMNHPAWIFGHMSLYHPMMVGLINGESFDDPKDDEVFGFAVTQVSEDPSLYGTKASILKRYAEGHEQVAQALLAATPERLSALPSLPRWRETKQTVGFMLPDLMLHHESTHIGQLSIWRRAAGLPKVEYPSRAPREGIVLA
jgi:DinB superfamily